MEGPSYEVCVRIFNNVVNILERSLTTSARSIDLALECFSKGRERHLDEWRAVLPAAAERFVLYQVFVPKDSLLGIIEVHWNA